MVIRFVYILKHSRVLLFLTPFRREEPAEYENGVNEPKGNKNHQETRIRIKLECQKQCWDKKKALHHSTAYMYITAVTAL